MRKKENSLIRAAKGLARIQLPVLFLLCLMMVGVTAGFLVSTDSALNRLSSGHNTAGIVESYAPPSSFAKGDEITKEVKVKNEGSIPCYVRVFAEISGPEDIIVYDTVNVYGDRCNNCGFLTAAAGSMYAHIDADPFDNCGSYSTGVVVGEKQISKTESQVAGYVCSCGKSK